MKGLTLLKNIKRGNIRNDDTFIYREDGAAFDKEYICYSNGMVYFDLITTKVPLTSINFLNGEFIPEKEYQRENQIIEWLQKHMNENDLFYFHQNDNNKNIIDCYFKCDDTHFCEFYKEKIERLINEQEEII